MVDLFSGEVESFPGGKDFSSNTSRKQNEKMKFLGSSKIWDEISLSDIFFKKKRIFENDFVLNFSPPDFGKPQKFHDFILFSAGFTGENLRPDFHFRFFPRVVSFSQSVLFFSKNKTLFFPQTKMRFSIEVQDEPKMFFHSFPAAEKATGLNRQTIRDVLERGNKVYHRKADHKLFHITKEDPILIARIEGEEFFSLEEIQTKLDLSPTKFLNQIKSGKFAKQIDWISDELFPEKNQQVKKSDELEEIKSQLKEMKLQMEEMKLQFERKMEEMKSQLQKKQEEIDVSKVPSQESFFKPKTDFPLYSFNINFIARFIRSGIIGKIQSSGPKTHRNVLVNGRKEYLPDLVEQIIKDHIAPVLENETQEQREKRIKQYIDFKGKKIDGLTTIQLCSLRKRLRTLDPVIIMDISKELMKLI